MDVDVNPNGRESAAVVPMSAGGGSQALTWKVEAGPDGLIRVSLRGEVDENANLVKLASDMKGRVTLDLADVRRINSAGVREWVNFVRNLPNVEEMEFVRCSPTIVNQLNMIYNFRGEAVVKTFFAPYLCEHCDVEVDVLLDVDVHFHDRDPKHVPEFRCQHCGNLLEFDDIPERYFAFVAQV
ncbi:MAG: hypothetical protein J7M25_07860 [Deltaproteobacteria bacterium]|nr:hypothetical protein [Deltaproteobacteria bacterium]